MKMKEIGPKGVPSGKDLPLLIELVEPRFRPFNRRSRKGEAGPMTSPQKSEEDDAKGDNIDFMFLGPFLQP